MENSNEPVVSFKVGLILIQSALFFDALQWISESAELIPGAGQVIALILSGTIDSVALITFGATLFFSGFSILNLRRGGSLIVTTLLELIPVVNVLPGWSLWATTFILTNLTAQVTGEGPTAVK